MPMLCSQRWRHASAPKGSDFEFSATTVWPRPYADTILALPEMAEWTAGAETEIKARMIA